MKEITLGASALIMTCLLGSCVYDWFTSTPQAVEVTITDKHYTPGHYTQSCEKSGCSSTWHAPSWSVQYEDGVERFRTTVSSGTYETLGNYILDSLDTVR